MHPERPPASITIHVRLRDLVIAVVIGALAVIPLLLAASPVGPLTTFSNGQYADATAINANFAAVRTAVDDNARVAARAIVSFDGTSCSGAGNTCTLRMTKGVASVVRTAAGQYRINWTTPFANLNYAVVGACQMLNLGGPQFGLETNTDLSGMGTGFITVGCRDPANTNVNSNLVHVVAFGD